MEHPPIKQIIDDWIKTDEKSFPKRINSYNCPKCDGRNSVPISYDYRRIGYVCWYCGNFLGKINGEINKVIEEQTGIRTETTIERLSKGIKKIHNKSGGETQVYEKIGKVFIKTNNINGEN